MLFVLFMVLYTASFLLMAVFLRRSVKKTLYSYKNIGLTAGMIFNLVLILVTVYWAAVEKDGLSSREFLRRYAEFPRSFSKAALFAIFALCAALLVSNIALIRHEGYHLQNALSIVLAAFYIGGSMAAYLLTDAISERLITEEIAAGNRLALLLKTALPMAILLFVCYLECVLAGAILMGYAAAKRIPAYDKDYVIVLGCSIDKRGGLLPLLKGRVNRAVRFAWDQERESGKPVRYVPSGGQGANEIISEGTAMEFYLLTHGAESYEVFPEKKSRNTEENMVFSKKLIDSLTPDAKIAFSTTNYHVLRSGILAEKAGFHAEGIAAPTKWYFWPNGFIREFFAILAMEKKTHLLVAAGLFLMCIVFGAAVVF